MFYAQYIEWRRAEEIRIEREAAEKEEREKEEARQREIREEEEARQRREEEEKEERRRKAREEVRRSRLETLRPRNGASGESASAKRKRSGDDEDDSARFLSSLALSISRFLGCEMSFGPFGGEDDETDESSEVLQLRL